MKNLSQLILLCTILIFTLSACSDDNDSDRNGSSLEDFPIQQVMMGNLTAVTFDVDVFNDEMVAAVSILVDQDTEEVSLQVDGNDITLQRSGSVLYSEDELDLAPGQSFSYELELDGTTDAGTITMPLFVEIDFPETFDPESDFSLSWNIEESPDLFVVHHEIETSDSWEYEEDFVEGDERSHTISSDIFSGFDSDEISGFGVGIEALNFNHDEALIAAFTSSRDQDKHYRSDGSTRSTHEGNLRDRLTFDREQLR